MPIEKRVETRRGPHVTMTGPFPVTPPVVAMVPCSTEHKIVGFKFQDTIAEYVSEEFDPLHPNGYGEVREDKYGHVHKSYSYIAGLIGGITEVKVYPAQFGLPAEPGFHYDFHITPADLMAGCVQAIMEQQHPPEYVI